MLIGLLIPTGIASISADGCWQPAPCEDPTPLRYSGGTGVVDREAGITCPYELSTPDDLIALSQSPEDWDKDFVLTRSLDLCDLPISPIGSKQRPFTGSFNGQFFAIRHFAIDPGAAQAVGLFGAIGPAGSVSELAVSDVAFAASPDSNARVGGLVGVNEGRVRGVSVAADLGSEDGFHTLGGIAGQNASGAVIGGSAFSGTLGPTCNRTGGIAGSNEGTIHDSLARGTLSSAEARGACGVLGGLVGDNALGEIRHSLAVVAMDFAATPVGGLVGASGDGVVASFAAFDTASPDLPAIGDASVCKRPDCALSGASAGAATLDPSQLVDPGSYADWTPFVWSLEADEFPVQRWHAAFDTRPTVCGGSLGAVCGQAFFDANANGRHETGEPALAGARISLAPPDPSAESIVVEAGADGGYCFHLVEGAYAVSAIVPECGATWLPTTSTSMIDVLAKDLHGLDVGAVCLGGAGARDSGFWLLPEGRFLLTLEDAVALNDLPSFAAAGPGGEGLFDETDVEAFRDQVAAVLGDWPLRGVPEQLAAAILATELNLRKGFLEPQARLAVADGRFEPIGSLLFQALAASACSLLASDPACLGEQQLLAEALERANADRDFVQSEPCDLVHCEEQPTASTCSREVCDGADNNCDGAVDNGLLDLVAGTDVGECRLQVRSCVSGLWEVTDPGAAPISEVCGNGLDNDCNGEIDNPELCDPFFVTGTFQASPGKPLKATHEEASLELDRDAVDADTELTITPLRLAEVPGLDPGMTNVTKGPRYGYRFQPHGVKFKKKIKVKLPYNPQKLPPGSTDAEIRTFYFDDQTGRWHSLEIVEVDESKKEITSLTDHFTDMINATVTVPDHPEVESHTPTTLKDIAAAEPGQGINLIEPPSPGSTGEARLAYPIEVPPGRRGMQPSLAITYDSSRANGWLGVGWDLPYARITIDTRWGVPRYDTDQETETYIFEGEQLTPLAHRGSPQLRTTEKAFHKRVEGGFQRIVRHGDHPAAYWWEVVEKNGVRSFYGGHPDAGGVVEEGILKDARENIFEWALVENLDLNGNAVRYEYERVEDAGVEGVPVPCPERCEELYLRRIDYTRSAGSAGAYAIEFIRENGRPDVIIDARGGFRRVTAELLERIEISFRGSPVRSYDLDYAEGSFHKTLLQSITQRGADGSVFHTHRFDYFDESRDPSGAYVGFEPAEVWPAGDDGVDAGLFGFGSASAISGAAGESLGGHLYVGFNATTATKVLSAGGKLGHTSTETETVLALVDVDGDELPDKLFKKDDQVYYRSNQSGPSGAAGFGVAVPLPTLPGISEENSATTSGGAEAYFLINGLVNEAFSFAETSSYLTDVNADGLLDLVREDGTVLFNRRGPGGLPVFDPDSGTTLVPIDSGPVDGNGLVPDEDAIEEELEKAFPLHDTLRRWVAPFGGEVAISGSIYLAQEPGVAPCLRADGVEAAIQRNGGELWSEVVAGTTAVEPAGVEMVPVNRGDRIYFRLQSRFDGSCDRVVWDPQIQYAGDPSTDANLKDPLLYRSSDDFTLGGRRGISVRAPVDGIVRLEGDLEKPAVTTDDVTVVVSRNGAVIFSQTLGWDRTGVIPVNFDFPVRGDNLATEPVESDEIVLRVKVDSPIDVGLLEWAPRLYYIQAPGLGGLFDANGEPLFQLRPPYDVDLYPVNDLVAPQVPWVAPASGRAEVVARLVAAETGTVVFTAKTAGRRLAKRIFTLRAGIIQFEGLIFDVDEGDEVFLDFSVYDPDFGRHLLQHLQRSVTVEGTSVEIGLHVSDEPDFFPLAYRGWSAGGYEANLQRALLPIIEDNLALPKASRSYDPRTAESYPFFGDAFEENFDGLPTPPRWRSAEPRAWASATEMSSSRLGIASLPDVPGGSAVAGRRAVSRLSLTDQTAVGITAGLLSGSTDQGSSSGELDFRDLNGDRFPDVVSVDRIQYTTPRGGLEAENRQVDGHRRFRVSANTGLNGSIGGSPAAFFGSGKAKVHPDGDTASRSNRTGPQMQPLGVGVGIGDGTSNLRLDLIDMNGDGLPDRVQRTEGKDCQGNEGDDQICVELNLGYAFAPPDAWGLGTISKGDSDTLNLSPTPIGFNAGLFDFAGGISLAGHRSRAESTLLDLNGDGLPDVITPGSAPGSLVVAFNTGGGFAPSRIWPSALESNVARSASVQLGAGVYFTIAIPVFCGLTACAVILNPGLDGSTSMNRDEVVVMDVDGDGYPDHLFSATNDTLHVARSPVGRTNLLKTVHRPLGAHFELSYERIGNTFEQPESRWVLSRLELVDGHPGDGVDTLVKTYRYTGGLFDRFEREFYGFLTVQEQERNPTTNDSLYREVVRHYGNESYYTRGLLVREVARDASARPIAETQHTHLLRDVETQAEPADPLSRTASIFPQLVRSEARFFDDDGVLRKTTFEQQSYDLLGNVTALFDSGDAESSDDLQVSVSYSDCPNTHVVGIPVGLTVANGASLLRRRSAVVDCNTGNLLQVRELMDDRTAVTDLGYFPSGNLEAITGPTNHKGQRYRLTYQYDPEVQTHVVSVRDSFGYESRSSYDLRFGQVLQSIDSNQNPLSFAYDPFGRLISVRGPYEESTAAPSIEIEYHHQATDPWALSRLYDPFRDASDPIEIVVFADGLGRIIQRKRDATVREPSGLLRDVMVVSGHKRYDHAGRTAETFYPTTEELGTAGGFQSSIDSVPPTRLSYDLSDRRTRVVFPDGTAEQTLYGFAPDRSGRLQFETLTIDANGRERREYTNSRRLNVAVRSEASGEAIWMSFDHDAMGQVRRVVDNLGNETLLEYDRAGRLTVLDSPDAGRTTFAYDLASNPVRKQTANLAAVGQAIEYEHDFNRLLRTSYPQFPENGVEYRYGDAGAPDNAAGRLVEVRDASGSRQFAYGRLGETVRVTRAIASETQGQSTQSPEVYVTQFAYDSWGRLQQLTYPDGEVLEYRYDSGGLVTGASGEKSGRRYEYLRELGYNKFGQQTGITFGNGVRSVYTYDPLNQRLAALQSILADGTALRFLSYAYDAVGNPLSVTNAVPRPRASEMGGPSAQSFEYDDLDRLIGAAGWYQFAPNKESRYTLGQSYDSIDNIRTKAQKHVIVQPSGVAISQKRESYDWSYAYDGPRPHAPTHVGDRSFAYDLNGNLVSWEHDRNGTRRSIERDEENRIRSISDVGHEERYVYDASGERVLKYGPQGETVYVNEFFTIRNREVATKHVFANSTRVASKLMKQDKPGSNAEGEVPLEKDQYFQHPDHLGGVTYVTDLDGELYQHLEYFPSGETWIEEVTDSRRVPYGFSGNLLDPTTGLYYVGARYFDPRVGVWQGTDPALEGFAGDAPNGGFENPANQNLYAFSRSNPVRFLDRNGEDWRGMGKRLLRGLVYAPTAVVETAQAFAEDPAGTAKHLAIESGKAALFGAYGPAGLTVYQVHNDLEEFKTDPDPAGLAVELGGRKASDFVIGRFVQGAGRWAGRVATVRAARALGKKATLLPSNWIVLKEGDGFSGVFDPKTGATRIKHSRLAENSRDLPTGFVNRSAGHSELLEELKAMGLDTSEVRAFTLVPSKKKPGAFDLQFKSSINLRFDPRYVNGNFLDRARLFDQRTLPKELQPEVRKSLEKLFREKNGPQLE